MEKKTECKNKAECTTVICAVGTRRKDGGIIREKTSREVLKICENCKSTQPRS